MSLQTVIFSIVKMVLDLIIQRFYNTKVTYTFIVLQKASKNLAMSLQDFQIITKLGEGAYSCVYKVKRLIDESIYALKKVKLLNLSTRQIHNAVNQVRILASIRHPNIIGYKEAFYDSTSKSLCIVMEYADGGDLLQKIFQHKKKGGQFDEEYIWEIFIQVTRGLTKLHELKVLHRDIKSANIFLTKNGIAKLGDMNVSKVVRKQAMCQTQTGTPYYASPQVWHDEPYDSKSDIWSLGCVLYEFINLKPPFRARDMQGLYKKVTRGYFSRINKNYSDDLMVLLKKLIKVNPKERIIANQILQLAIVKKHIKKNKQLQVDQKSILLKTIKLTKNINYLTERLPKPNYSPLRLKSISPYKSSLSQRYVSKNPYDMHVSLPPIKSSNNDFLKVKNQKSNKYKIEMKSVKKIKEEPLIKSQRGSQRRVLKSEISLPKIVMKTKIQAY